MKKIVLFLFISGLFIGCKQSPPPEKLAVEVNLDNGTCKINPSKEVAYFGTIGSDSVFIFFYDRDSFAAAIDYSNFRCLMGTADSLQECKIMFFNRMRDGGTTQISIADTGGVYYEYYNRRLSDFYFPFIRSGPDSATFNHRPIKRL